MLAEPAARAALRAIVAILWLYEILHILLDASAFAGAAVALVVLYLAIAALVGPRRSVLMAYGLILSAGLIALLIGRPRLVLDGLAFSTFFPAFLATVVIVRTCAAIHPAIGRAKARVASLTEGQREIGFMAGAHALGAVVTAGSFSILAPLMAESAPEDERHRLALAALRGTNLAVLWSPFFVGMAMVTAYIPQAPIWQLAPLGLGLASLGFAIVILRTGITTLRLVPDAVRALVPILPPVGLAAGLIILIASLTGIGTLETVFLTIPPLVLLWLFFQPRDTVVGVRRKVWDGLGHITAEMLLVVSIFVAASVIAEVPVIRDGVAMLVALPLPTALLLAVLLAAIVLAGMAGIHPIATVAVLLALLAGSEGPVPQLSLAAICLVGWALGTIASPASLTVVIASACFRVGPARLAYRGNLAFVLIFGVACVLVIDLVGRLAG